MPDGQVKYALSGADVFEPLPETAINGWIGKRVHIHFEDLIHCVVSGKRIKKTYGEGMSYDAFLKSPLACPSIIRPELSRIHEGIALRDEAWERANHEATKQHSNVQRLSILSIIKDNGWYIEERHCRIPQSTAHSR